jgi:hypothetical protein
VCAGASGCVQSYSLSEIEIRHALQRENPGATWSGTPRAFIATRSSGILQYPRHHQRIMHGCMWPSGRQAGPIFKPQCSRMVTPGSGTDVQCSLIPVSTAGTAVHCLWHHVTDILALLAVQNRTRSGCRACLPIRVSLYICPPTVQDILACFGGKEG